MTLSVDVVIVAFRSDQRVLAAAVDSVRRQEGVRGRIWVVCQGTTEPVLRINDGPGDWDLEILTRADNLGFTGANNLAARWFVAGDASAFLVLNPDVVLEPDCLAQLVAEAVARDPSIVGPLLEQMDGATLSPTGHIDSAGIVWTAESRHLDYRHGEPLRDVPADPYRVAGVTGAALLVTREAIRRLLDADGELFDDTYFAYREDAELGLRAATVGVQCYVVPSARGRHVRSVRGTERSASTVANRLGVQNRFMLLVKYGRHRPGVPFRALLRDVLVLAGVVVRERTSWEGVRHTCRIRRFVRMRGQQVLRRPGASEAIEFTSNLHPIGDA